MELTRTERRAVGELVRQMNGPPLPPRRRGPVTTKEVAALSAPRLRALAARYEIPRRVWATERVAFHNLPRERQISLVMEEINAYGRGKFTNDKVGTALQNAFVRHLCLGRRGG